MLMISLEFEDAYISLYEFLRFRTHENEISRKLIEVDEKLKLYFNIRNSRLETVFWKLKYIEIV